jgi:hypothetical protein
VETVDPEERLSAIEDAIQQLAEVMGQLCEKVQWHDEQLDSSGMGDMKSRLESIESDFGNMDDGFNGLLTTRKKGRYSEMLGSNEALKGYAPKYNKAFKRDLFSDAVDNIMAAMDQEGASEDAIPQIVDQLISELKDRFDEEDAESPAEESAEHAPGGSEAGITDEAPKPAQAEVKVTEVSPGDGLEKVAKLARNYRGARLG